MRYKKSVAFGKVIIHEDNKVLDGNEIVDHLNKSASLRTEVEKLRDEFKNMQTDLDYSGAKQGNIWPASIASRLNKILGDTE